MEEPQNIEYAPSVRVSPEQQCPHIFVVVKPDIWDDLRIIQREMILKTGRV